MSDISEIGAMVKRVYNGKAWHGPNIMDVLKTVDEKTARKKIGNSNSIVQLILHMTSWRTFVTKRLQGDVTFDITEDTNFPAETDWATALKKFEQSHAELIKAIEVANDELLREPVANRKYDFFILLHGIIHHDIYHLGQIQLISKYG